MHDHGHLSHLIMDMETVNWAVFLSITWFSFAMSWHCAVMCGPLVCARFTSHGNQKSSLLANVIAYNFGRLLSYSTLGAVIGVTTDSLQDALTRQLPNLSLALTLFFAGVVAWQGITLLRGKNPAPGPTWLSKINASPSRLNLDTRQSLLGSIAFGVATVFLPCMTLAAALAGAAMVADPLMSAMVLAGFALGTIPVMILMPTASSSLASLARNNTIGGLSIATLRRIAGCLLIVVSAMTILRLAH